MQRTRVQHRTHSTSMRKEAFHAGVLLIAASCFNSNGCGVSCQVDVTQAEEILVELPDGLAEGGQSRQVLHVLECEGPQEWQLVNSTDSIVLWMRELTDRLTINDDEPQGEDLMV